ncbi:MAG: glycosyltransferase family 39 protein [Candidatus Latescibacterota bacterium]|nr:MAG: glycosyltransferase family 39 protein [Candidatus Latescibacterota bacterium]
MPVSADTSPTDPSSSLDRLPRAHVFVFFLLIAMAILGTFLFVSHYYPVVGGETDGVFYMMRSSTFFSVDPYHGPGFPWAIRVVRFFGVPPFPAAKLVSMISALLLLIAVYRLFATMSRPGEAAVATYVLALNPLFLIYSVAIMSDMLALALVFWVLAILFSHEGTRPSRLFLAGVIAGMAYLSRYLYLFLLLVPVLMVVFRIHDTEPRRGFLRRIGCFYAGFLVFTLPWFVFMIRETGDPFFNLNHLLVAMRMYVPKLDFNKQPKLEAYPSLYHVIASDPKKFLHSWLVDLRQLPRGLLELVPNLGVISAFGALAWIVRITRKKAILLVVTLLYSLVICIVWLFDRLFLFLSALDRIRHRQRTLSPALMASVQTGVSAIRIARAGRPASSHRDYCRIADHRVTGQAEGDGVFRQTTGRVQSHLGLAQDRSDQGDIGSRGKTAHPIHG